MAFAYVEQSPQVDAFGLQPHFSKVPADDLDNPRVDLSTIVLYFDVIASFGSAAGR